MPVELHVHAARPLDHRVSPDRVRERRDLHIGAGLPRRRHRLVHVTDQVAAALGAERVGDPGGEPEQRHATDRRVDQLGRGGRGRRRHREHDLLRALAAERCDEALDEAVNVGGSHVDVGRVILRPHSRARREGGRDGRRGAEAEEQDDGGSHHDEFPW